MRVSLFVTCVVDIVRPGVAESAVRVLERAGHEVDVPLDQTCCGQPAWNAGYPDEARAVARQALRSFAGSDAVVCLAGSCATMVRVFYRELFESEPDAPQAESLASRVREFSELLAGSSLPPDDSGGSPVAYHDSCHMLRELGIREQPRSLLAAAGCVVVEMQGAQRCCGFGGTFAVKLPEVSVAMADEKLDEAVATGAGAVVGCDTSCLLHLEARARRRGLPLEFRHLAEVLDS